MKKVGAFDGIHNDTEDDKMAVEERVIQAYALLLVLTAIAVPNSANPYPGIMFAGALMVLFTLRSLKDSLSGLLAGMQAIVSVAFAVGLDGCLPYLILYEIRLPGCGWLQIVLPALAYFGQWVTWQKETFPQAICNMILLTGMAGGLGLVERAASGYFMNRSRIAQAVSVTAVNELYEKKLNQELVIRNYLTEKNARLEERENISRNIHNSVGHSITAAVLALEAADELFDQQPARAREKMNAAKARVQHSLEGIRRAVRVLDEETEYVAMGDLLQELTGVSDHFAMDTRITVYTDYENAGTELLIPREHTEFLTGALQEFLVNGVRHGGADVFLICLTADSGHIRLEVSDNGSSDFQAENQEGKIQKGFGLKKLLLYVKRCGGTMTFTNETGFRVVMTLPFKVLIDKCNEEGRNCQKNGGRYG